MRFDKYSALLVASLFSFILAAHWFVFYVFGRKVGDSFIQGGNLVANRYQVDRAMAIGVFDLFRKDLAELSPSLWQWTIGNGRFYPIYIGIFLAILGLIFLFLAFGSKRTEEPIPGDASSTGKE